MPFGHTLYISSANTRITRHETEIRVKMVRNVLPSKTVLRDILDSGVCDRCHLDIRRTPTVTDNRIKITVSKRGIHPIDTMVVGALSIWSIFTD
jgi:hypothetical protein